MDPHPISPPRTSSSAISSLVCGLLGCVPFLTGLAAVILGIVGIRKTRDPMVTGRGMAIAGLILGCLSLAGWTIGTGGAVVGIFFVFKVAEPARAAGEQFTRDLSEGKVDAAVASSVEGIDRAALEALGERMKPWGAFQALGMNNISVQTANGREDFTIGGQATFALATRSYTMTIHKEGGAYKVAKVDFP